MVIQLILLRRGYCAALVKIIFLLLKLYYFKYSTFKISNPITCIRNNILL